MATGYVIYDGPSALDGERVVVIVTALNGSRNIKTGNLIQTYILRADMHPIEAVRSGADVSICGDCKHRGDGTGAGRSCYVTLGHGPSTVWKAWSRGVYDVAKPEVAALALAGRMIRLGTYGDPAAVPIEVWQELTRYAEGWTGYSHQWRAIDRAWSRLVMASADTLAEASEAQALGYRTFRVGAGTVFGKEVRCPASAEMGKLATCAAWREARTYARTGGCVMDKITEIVVRYIETLEKIEAELTDDVQEFAERAMRVETDNRYLIEVLEIIASGEGDPVEMAQNALDRMTCRGSE